MLTTHLNPVTRATIGATVSILEREHAKNLLTEENLDDICTVLDTGPIKATFLLEKLLVLLLEAVALMGCHVTLIDSFLLMLRYSLQVPL
jgi:hypothetical protein